MLNEALITDAMRQAAQAERLSPETLAQLQEETLRRLLRHAVVGSSFYGRLYRGIDIERAPLTELPTVTKELIQKHFDEVVTDRRLRLDDVQRYSRTATPQTSPFYLGEFALLQSSGTSGLRGWYVWDSAALAAALAAGYRQSQRDGPPTGGERMAAILHLHPTDATCVLLGLIPASVGSRRLIDISQELPQVVEELNTFQPTHLATYPYMLWLLAEAARAGKLHIRPQRITSSADVLTGSDRTTIRSIFGSDPFDYYCSTEVPYLAWECSAHDGLHVNADHVLLESVDAKDRPVTPGTLGDKILVTNLVNHAMPLIRYEMSDQVEYATAACPCGCRLPRIRTIAGRVENVLSLPGADGTPVRLIEEYVDNIVGPVEGVARYQVIQEEATRLKVNVIVRDGTPWEDVCRAVLDRLESCFRKYHVDSTRFELALCRCAELEPVKPGTRKVCRFWNRVHTA
jgi:phenylacetate-coenzyme A ligase PaaK-like adenylate-forming protein